MQNKLQDNFKAVNDLLHELDIARKEFSEIRKN